MNKTFKIISIINLVISLPLALFFAISVILALSRVLVLYKLHLIVLLVLVGVNVCYVIYNLLTLVLNNALSKK